MGPYSDTNPHIVASVYIREIKHSIYSEYSYIFSLVLLDPTLLIGLVRIDGLVQSDNQLLRSSPDPIEPAS